MSGIPTMVLMNILKFLAIQGHGLNQPKFVEIRQHRRAYVKQEIGYYNDNTAEFHLEKIYLVSIHTNPGRQQHNGSCYNI
jgi:hypothetical protein